MAASETLAWRVQASGALALAAGLVVLWRSRAAYELKAAALAAGALITTPYLYIYDFVVLAVAVAFLLRLALMRGFTASEIVGLPIASALILAFPYMKTQLGLARSVDRHCLGGAAGAQRKLRRSHHAIMAAFAGAVCGASENI